MDFLSRAELQKATKQIPHPVKFTNIDFNMNEIAIKLRAVNSYTYDDLVCIVSNSYQTILHDIFLKNQEMRDSIIEAFNNITFVKAFIEVMSKVRLTDTQVFCCNKIAWDYMTFGLNKAIKDELLQLSNIINRDTINRLSVYLGLRTSEMVALARYSSFRDKRSAQRVNQVLCLTKSVFSVQTLVEVYAILYRTSVTELFQAVMYDTGNSTCNIQNFDNITFAVFHILNNMPSNEIRSVLYSFAVDYKLNNRSDKLRLDVSDFASRNNFSRVINIIDHLRVVENVHMPL